MEQGYPNPYVPFDGPTEMRHNPPPVYFMTSPALLPVIRVWRDEHGTFSALSDGRVYQHSFGEWVAHVPPLTDAQRMPRYTEKLPVGPTAQGDAP